MMDFSLITDEPLNYCVYAHVNKQNGKMYIGITCRLEQRWSAHGYYYQPSTKFWRAIQKYGWDNFEHIVLIDGLPKTVAYIYEKELIAKYDAQNNGYNILSGGEFSGALGKKVYQYDLDGNYIREWENGQTASIETGTSHYYLCKCAKEDRPQLSSGGYQWRYYKQEKIPPYLIEDRRIWNGVILQFSMDGILLRRYDDIYHDDSFTYNEIKHIQNVCNESHYAYQSFWFWEKDYTENKLYEVISNRKPYSYHHERGVSKKRVYQYSLDGVLLNVYESASEAAKLTGMGYDNISGACNRPKKRHYCNNYLWYYYNDCNGGENVKPFDGVKNKTKLYQYSIDGKFIKEYESITQADSEFKGLKSALKRGKNIHHNYLWMREFNGDFMDMEVN